MSFSIRFLGEIALPAVAAVSFAVSSPLAAQTPAEGYPVVVARATEDCFSDMVRVTGFVVARREAVVNVDTEGSRVTELLVHEGDLVTQNQELARLSPPPGRGGARANPIVLRAPVAGLVTNVHTAVGAPVSPQAEPMFRIAVNNELELDAEVPSIRILKLNPGAAAHISRENGPDLAGHVRVVLPEIDRKTQLGHVRISLTDASSLRVGLFVRVGIDAKQSCGVAVPRSAVDHGSVQVVTNNVVETRQVQTGLTSDARIEILDGLKAGELVVADAGTSLHNGDRVKPTVADESDRSKGR
jgi:multidrug efflux pump subunit AcrA (membrane-fusion protein)